MRSRDRNGFSARSLVDLELAANCLLGGCVKWRGEV